MRDVLLSTLAAGVLLTIFVAVLRRKGGTEKRDERDPDAPRNPERSRASSEAAATLPAHAPLSDADAAQVAELHDYFQEIGTGEHATVRLHRVRRHHVYKGPTTRQLAVMRDRALAPVRQFEADPLTAPIPAQYGTARPVMAPREEPDAWLLGSFTDQWTTADIERMVAEAKAEAAR